MSGLSKVEMSGFMGRHEILLQNVADFLRYRFHFEGFGKKRHCAFFDSVADNRVVGVAGHVQDLRVIVRPSGSQCRTAGKHSREGTGLESSKSVQLKRDGPRLLGL